MGSFNGAATLGLRKAASGFCKDDAWNWLQWSRNFRVAESAECRRKHLAAYSLQWSRNFRVAERTVWTECLRVAKPLQWSRNFRVAERPARARKQVEADLLQWSRNFRVAESEEAVGTGGPLPALQWSRNFRVAESPQIPRGRCGTSARFNGAATLGLRKAIRGAGRMLGYVASMEPQL